VFCIKDTYDLFADFCDFHFFNDCNLPHKNGFIGYRYKSRSEPIVVSSSGFNETTARSRVGSFQRWDIFCQVLDPNVHPHNNMGYVLENGEFEKGIFDKTYDRPCGPSLTIETVIYFAVHLGVKNIFGIGLDGGTKWEKISSQDREGLHLDASPKTQHELEYKNWEIEITNTGTGILYDWLKGKNIDFSLISDISNWNQKIPRLCVEELKKII